MPEEKVKVWTIRDLMKSAIEHFQKKGFEEARLNVELLLSHALKMQRIQLYLNFDKPLTATELRKFHALYERRLRHEPIQYIIGNTYFMGLQFNVDPRVLIPRQETETLVEQAMMFCNKYPNDKKIQILEVGTGCGNIAISIAKYVKRAEVTAIDLSNEALVVAKKNAIKHNVESRIKFLCKDIFEKKEKFFSGQFDLLISNPPYVPKDEWEQLAKEIREYEPPYAITDGRDGYHFYRRIAEVAPDLLKPFGGLMVEVGLGQAELVKRIFKQANIGQLETVCDLQGIQRVVMGIFIDSKSKQINFN